ncbi:hypothetical protein [Streptomyces sp. AC555_RSS877]|uniref:hypothetical protein n=1 Tax=Streptomyces sp. AC555_RSS877 TaxID=2823688 RepID=UPI001C27E1D2|nr:hypothetical protein [Streptomyces sp. AC555_RSS877]
MGSCAKAGELVAVTGAARVWVWVTAVVTGLAAVALTLVAVLADLDTAGQAASVAGAVAGMIALLVSVITLFRGGGGPGNGRTVRAGRGAIVSGGNITGSALGKNSKVTGPPSMPGTPPAQRDGDDVRARRDGIAASGDITDSALGEGSER